MVWSRSQLCESDSNLAKPMGIWGECIAQPCQGDSHQKHFQAQHQAAKTQLSLSSPQKTSSNP